MEDSLTLELINGDHQRQAPVGKEGNPK